MNDGCIWYNIESQNKKFFHMAMTKERAWYYTIGMLQADEVEPSEEMMGKRPFGAGQTQTATGIEEGDMLDRYVYIYFQELPADYTLGDIEDDLDDLLGDMIEVTGTGLGITGGNIDIEYYEKSDALHKILSYLMSCGFDSETILDINGDRKKLSEFDEMRYENE